MSQTTVRGSVWYSRMLGVFTCGLLAAGSGWSAEAQGWQHVINLQGQRGSAIGGGTGTTLYAGLGSGDVLRSDDNGLTWTVMNQGLVDDGGRKMLPKAFVVTPSGRVIRGGDNASWQNKVGSPIFHSDNRGAQWREVPLPFAGAARNPAGIGASDLVMHQGAVYFSDLLSEGVWKSIDQGVTWTSVGNDLPTVPFIGFAKTYYAVASAGDALLTVEATRGVFRSTDGGATWVQAVRGIPGVANSPLVGGRTWTGHDVVGQPDGTAFSVVDNRVYRSRDAGASWEEVGADFIVGPNPFAPSVIQPVARKVEVLGDRVYVATVEGNPRFFEGADLGDSWAELPRIPVGGETPSILAQSFAAHGGALYAAGTNGVHRLNLATAGRTPLLPRVSTSVTGPFGLNVGSTLEVRASARGTAPFTYEWRLSGVPLTGQSGPLLRITAHAGDVGGALSLVVRNAAGSVTNELGALTVAPREVGVVDYGFRPQDLGGAAVTTFAIAGDGSVFYGGSFASTTGMFTGVRRVFADGIADPSFVTGGFAGGGTGPGSASGTPSVVFPLGDGSVLVGATATSNARYYRRLMPDGSADNSWPWPAEIAGGPRKIVRLADGRYLIGGGSEGGIHRLNADGSFDTSFRGPASLGRFQQNYVADILVLDDGRILVGGSFDTVDAVRQVALARLLPDGALDRSWIPAVLPGGSTVKALALMPGGKILIGGAFSSVGGQTRRGLARLLSDGQLDITVGDFIPASSPVPTVNVFAVQPDGRIWVGGLFLQAGGRDSLFRLNVDGSVDTTFPDVRLRDRGGVSPVAVSSLAYTTDGRLWIGTSGGEAGGYAAGQLFRVYTDSDGPAVGYAGLDQTPYLGESITLQGAVTGPYHSVRWRKDGILIPGATDVRLPLVNVTAAASGAYDLVVTSTGGSHTSAVARVRVRGPVVIDRPPVPAIAVVGGSASLSVTAFGKLPLHYQWLLDGMALSGATNRSLALTNLSLASAGDYSVRVLGGDGSTAQSESVYVTVIPVPGSTNSTFRLGLFKSVGITGFKDIEFLPDGRVLVGGAFATTPGGPNATLARLSPDGTVDSEFSFDATGITEFVAMDRQPDGRWVILARLGNPYVVRRLLENGAIDPAFEEQTVGFGLDVKVAPDGGVLALDTRGLWRFDAGGRADPGFVQRAQLAGAAQSIAVDESGRIYVAGSFNPAGAWPQAHLVRLLSDGTRDASFAVTNRFSSQWTVRAVAGGVLVADLNGVYRFDDTGKRDESYASAGRLVAWDIIAGGGLAAVLNGTSGEGVLRTSEGLPASPVSAMRVPVSFSSYSFLRAAPDGALWLALGSSGGSVDPATQLYKLNGAVTPLALVSAPVSRTVNTGERLEWTATAVGTSRVAYQWRRNGLPLSGAIHPTLVLESAQPADNGDYTVLVSNRSGSVESRPATLVVLGAPQVMAVRGGGMLVMGDTLRLEVDARGVAPLSYQWRRNGVPLEGAVGSNLVVRAAALTDAGTYDVVVQNSLGSSPSDSLTVAIEVRPGSVLGSFPGGANGSGMELNVLPGGVFLVDGKAYNRFGELQFTLPFPDGTSTVLRDRIAVDAVRERIYAGPTRRVRAYTLNGALVTDYAGPAANVRLVRVEAGGTVLQSTEGINFPFQRLDPTGALDPQFVPAVRPSLDARTLSDGTLLVMTFSQRSVGGRLVYNTLLDRLLPSGAIDPTFLRLTNVFAGGGQANRLYVDRQGRLLVLGGVGTADTNRLVRLHADGSVDATFRAPAIRGEVTALAQQLNGRLVIGGAFTEVDGQPRSLLARLNADGSHDVGFQPGTGLTTVSGQNVVHDLDLLPAGEIVVCGTFTHANGLPRNGLALFAGDSLDLYFVSEPTDLVLALGETAELTAEAAGTSPASFQWFKDGTPLSGQLGNRLVVGPATAGTAGEYAVVARNTAGEVTSRTARVAVIVAPEIIVPPSSQVADTGSNVVFEVEARGRQLSYQWWGRGMPIAGATNASLILPSVSHLQEGAYTVVVSNPAGTATARDAVLRVRPVVAPTGGIPFNGLLAETLFEGSFLERSNRLTTVPRGAPTFVPGRDGGQAARFVAGTDGLQLGLPTARLGGVAYTASFWIWPEERGSLNVYSLTLFLGSSSREHYLYLGGDDTAVGGQRVFLATRGLTSVHSSDERAYVPNLMGRWTHVAVVYRGGGPSQAANFTVYLDGAPVPLVNSANVVSGTGGGNGLATYGPSAAFRLDDFRLYQRAITEEEVLRLQRPGPAASRPQIVRHPVGGTVAVGGPFQMSVEASGEGMFYEWYRGDQLLAEADGPQLIIARAASVDTGDYRVVIRNAGGSTESAIATVTVAAGGGGQAEFSAWAATAGLSGDRALPGADADGDGVPNAAEFMHGTSPAEAGQRPLYRVLMVNVDGVSLPAVEFLRRTSGGGLTLVVQGADHPAFVGVEPGVTVSVTPVGGGLERVIHRAERPAGATSAWFFKFIVTAE